MEQPKSLRAIVAQLAGLPPLSLLGQPITGVELAYTVAINPEQPYAEAMRTPQVIAELGRCTAAALRAKEDAELAYRIWRDGHVHRLTNDVEAAKLAGFDCAVNPGVDAKNNPKEPKTPSIAAVEVYLRTLPEYRGYYDAQHAATETWAAFHAAFEGAKARQWAIRMKEDSGGNQTGPAAEPAETGPAWDPHASAAPAPPPIVAPAPVSPVAPAAPPPPVVAPPPPVIAPPPPVTAPPPPPVLAPPVMPPVGPPPPPTAPPTAGDNHPPSGFPPSGETAAPPGMKQTRKKPPPAPPTT